MLFVGAVGVNALAQGALRRASQWLWIEYPTFQLGGGHSTTELKKNFDVCDWWLTRQLHLIETETQKENKNDYSLKKHLVQ